MPPISQTWPMDTESPMISPSTNTGLKKVCPGVCSPPRHGSLWTSTSPSPKVESGISATQDRSRSGMPPIIDGQKSPAAISSPVGSARPQVKSSDSLKMVEHAVRISVTPMSRQIDTSMPLMMLSVTASMPGVP